MNTTFFLLFRKTYILKNYSQANYKPLKWMRSVTIIRLMDVNMVGLNNSDKGTDEIRSSVGQWRNKPKIAAAPNSFPKLFHQGTG